MATSQVVHTSQCWECAQQKNSRGYTSKPSICADQKGKYLCWFYVLSITAKYYEFYMNMVSVSASPLPLMYFCCTFSFYVLLLLHTTIILSFLLLFFQCTVTCGQGLRYRVVLCIDHRGMHTGGCSSKTKPHIKEECIVPTPCYKPKGNERKILMNFFVCMLTKLQKFLDYRNVSDLNFPKLEP